MIEFLVSVVYALLWVGILGGVFFAFWYPCYKECLEYLMDYGYDPVKCVKFSEIVLKPALKRYRKACAEKLETQNKSKKLEF